MAKDTVDAVAHGLDRKVPESCTEQVALVGADGFQALWNNRYRLAEETGLHVARIEHLLGRYGSLVLEVLDLVAADPTLAEPVTHADDYLRAEIVYAASHEGVRHLDDVLTRRTHISIETFDRGERCADEVARLIAPVLGWTPQQIERELRHYAMRVAAERESQQMPDDRTADSARLGAPEIVPVD
jgi:glycerol-3-phosphate dehydrogenase